MLGAIRPWLAGYIEMREDHSCAMGLTGRACILALGFKKPCQLGRESGQHVYPEVSDGQWLAVRLRQVGSTTKMGQTGEIASITPYHTSCRHIYSTKSGTGRLTVSSCRLRLTSQRLAHTGKLGLEERKRNL
jgi:hypothetical protein